MAPDPDGETATTSSVSGKSLESPDETTPLLSKSNNTPDQPRKWHKFVINRVLITAFIVSLSFGVTQVPLLYVFGVMSCEEYYRHHPLPPIDSPEWQHRCKIHTIDSSTARAIALLGAATTIFGVANLFVTGWMIKAWGVKKALLVSIFWPAVRLLIQNIGVMTGAGLGIAIITSSQAMTVVGGPAGYVLALNSFATEIVQPSERTATLGRLSGVAMFGTGLGFFSGGVLSDWINILAPFRLTLGLFCISALWSALVLPSIPTSAEVQRKASKSLSAFFEPLKMFTPRKWRLTNGRVRREYGVSLLGAGAFMAILATGYIPTLLQMYSTDIFDFGTTQNSALISLNFVIRASFLTFAFPAIIEYGRNRLKAKAATITPSSDSLTQTFSKDTGTLENETDDILPIEASQLAPVALPSGQATAIEPTQPLLRVPTHDRQSTTAPTDTDESESFAFDLLYTRYSLLIDGVLTLLAAFTSKDWHIYVVAAILPLAAGTGSAAKGSMLQMCAPDERVDALSAISLLESVARLSTISLFGLVFAAFVNLGQPSWTFVANSGVAILGFVVLMFARFPPAGAVRFGKEEVEEDGE